LLTTFEHYHRDGRFRVFIIGPMGPTPDAAPGRVPQEDHIANIQAAATRALTAVGLEPEQFVVETPWLQGANILDDVFGKIDSADFAIADMSSRSPNVFYEIAFFDALGVPTILLDRDGENLPFYWQQSRVHRLAEFDVPRLVAQFEPVFRAYFDPRQAVALERNPFTRFYGAPLVDISAATGIAVGFFENFARPVLAEGTGALAIEANGVERLVVIRPERVNDHDSDQALTRRRLATAARRTLAAPAHRRREVTALVLEDAIVDFPTPLYAMIHAPRYRKLYDRVAGPAHLADAVREAELARLETRFIESYFRTLRHLVDGERGLARRKLHVVAIRRFAEHGLDGLAD